MNNTRFYILNFLVFCSFCLLSSCSKEDQPYHQTEFVVAFKNPSESFPETSNRLEIELVFSEKAPRDGMISLSFETQNLIYGETEDFTCTPSAAENEIFVPIQEGTTGVSFQVNKWKQALPHEDKSINFSIAEIDMGEYPTHSQGNTSVKVFFTPTAALGGIQSPNVGGPNQPNQVYLSLSTKEETVVSRDTWDLGFYSGETFQVKINSSLYMFVAALPSTDIDSVSEEHIENLKHKMDFLVEGSDQYVDHPNGDIESTAIQTLLENEEENPVYLLKMGYEIGTETPSPGSVAIAGNARGYKKIRILRQEDQYVLQYADLNATSHNVAVISKTPSHNFTFFSLDTKNTVSVEPEKNNWDLNFTVKTEIQELPEGGNTAYGFSDYVEINNLGGVTAYRVHTSDFSYEDFTTENIEEDKFSSSQQIIGSSWREVTPPQREVLSNLFYILKDANGNYYKLKFLSFLNENGVRGYPKFEYKLLK